MATGDPEHLARLIDAFFAVEKTVAGRERRGHPMKYVLGLAFALQLALAPPSWGGFLNGNDLWGRCNEAPGVASGVCIGYVDAITDVLSAGNEINGFKACPPNSTSAASLA